MSRIGRLPIAIPAGVTVEIAENNVVTVKGPKGNQAGRRDHRSNKTKRSEEDEISSWSYKNTDQ